MTSYPKLSGYRIESEVFQETGFSCYIGYSVQDLDRKSVYLINEIDLVGISQTEIIQFRIECEKYDELFSQGIGIVKPFEIRFIDNRIYVIFEDSRKDQLRASLELSVGAGGLVKPGEQLKPGTLDLSAFLKFGKVFSQLLAQIHGSGLVHGYINPGSILLGSDGFAGGIPRLLGPGLTGLLIRVQQFLYSRTALRDWLPYIAPEQSRRIHRVVDYRSDFYSFGVVLYEMLTGVTPFASKDPLELIHSHIAKIPKSPHLINAKIPEVISEMVMTLLSKNAEERYQSTEGLIVDFEKCQTQLKTDGVIKVFKLKSDDFSRVFVAPQKLYGRQRPLEILLSDFEKASLGICRLAIVTGDPGVGKSSLVRELNKYVLEKKGYFLAGKYPQYMKDRPYNAFTQAFESLITQVLSESEEKVQYWRGKLKEALLENAQVIVDVVPQVELLLGKQPAVPELGPAGTQNRFNLVFQSFVDVFATREHPMVLYLDDLQWADTGSLSLIESLLGDDKQRCILFVIAYRSKEIDESHPAFQTLKQVQNVKEQTFVGVSKIHLSPLTLECVREIIFDMMGGIDPAVLFSLAELVYRKTEGNPLFVSQFLKSIYDENMLVFQPGKGWSCNLEQISRLRASESVVRLIEQRLSTVSPEVMEFLKISSCIGTVVPFDLLCLTSEKETKEIITCLRKAANLGIILQFDLAGTEDTIYFLHDRVHEAIYSLIPPEEKKITHYKIGRIWLRKVKEESSDRHWNSQVEENLFSIVNQLNIASDLIANKSEITELAKLNATAGLRAKGSNAYQSAVNYFSLAAKLVDSGADCTQEEKYLILKGQAESFFLSGDFDRAELTFDRCLNEPLTDLQKAEIWNVKCVLYFNQGQLVQSLDAGIYGLKLLGVNFPAGPNAFHVLYLILKIQWQIRGQTMESLEHLSMVDDPLIILQNKLLSSLGASIFILQEERPFLYPQLCLTFMSRSLTYGNSELGATGYLGYGIILLIGLGLYQKGYEFAELSFRVLDQVKDSVYRGQFYATFMGVFSHWRQPPNKTKELIAKGFQYSLQAGDYVYAAYFTAGRAYRLVNYGFSAKEGHVEFDQMMNFLKKAKRRDMWFLVEVMKRFVLCLEGQTESLAGFSNGDQSEEDFRKSLIEGGWTLRLPLGTYYMFKLRACCQFGFWEEGLQMYLKAKPLMKLLLGTDNYTDFRLYHALCLIKSYHSLSFFGRLVCRFKFRKILREMKTWAREAPDYFEYKYSLVRAEIGRATQKGERVLGHYERAIQAAKRNDLKLGEALCHEYAGEGHLELGLTVSGEAHIKEARRIYEAWGADGKVKYIDDKYPLFTTLQNAPTGTSSHVPGSDLSVLDLTTVLKSSQVLSEEIVLVKLVARLVNIVAENAGAERGFLVLVEEGNLVLFVKEKMAFESITFGTHQLSLPIVNYIRRTQQPILIGAKENFGTFHSDPYILKNGPKSIFCIPIMNQSKLIAILYLENRVAADVFDSNRIEILKLIVSQAAILIENSKLYTHLSELNKSLEEKVEQRTVELKKAQDQLVDTAHRAGMAEIATGALHNIGNTLNSVNINVEYLLEAARNSKIPSLLLVSEMLEKNRDQMSEFLSRDEKGKKIPEFIIQLSKMFNEEQLVRMKELKSLQKAIGIVKEVVATQQKYAQVGLHGEVIDLAGLINDVLTLQEGSLDRHRVVIEKIFSKVSPITVQKNKLMNVLINIFDNAKDAMTGIYDSERTVTIRLWEDENGVKIQICDHGAGIAPENMNQMFRHGFTTKQNGHGFGLHSAANALTEMGARIFAESDGVGKGATFTLLFPKTSGKLIKSPQSGDSPLDSFRSGGKPDGDSGGQLPEAA